VAYHYNKSLENQTYNELEFVLRKFNEFCKI